MGEVLAVDRNSDLGGFGRYLKNGIYYLAVLLIIVNG
jgi:hypothetical protein